MELNTNEIDDFRKGNHAVFEKLIETYKNRVYANVIRLVHHKNDAEEITQRVFIKCYLECKKFRGESKLSVWIYRIAYNEAINFIKKQKRWVFKTSFSKLDHQGETPSIFKTIEQEDKKEFLKTAMQNLTVEERWLIILWCYDEMSYKEIAAHTGLSLSNVKVKLHRGKHNLKQQLEPFKNNFYEGS